MNLNDWREQIDLLCRQIVKRHSGVRQYSLGNRIVVADRLPESSTASVMTHSFSPLDVR